MTTWPVLRGLTSQQVDGLICGGRRRLLRRGDTIHREGEAADFLQLLEHGRAAVRMLNTQGHQLIIDVLGPGSAFGDLHAVDRVGSTASQITALEPCSTIVVNRHHIDRLRPGGRDVEAYLVRSLVRRLDGLSERLMEIVYEPAPQRVLRRLLELDAEFGGDIAVTQDDLAMMAGTTRSTVNETLRGLERLGAIRTGRGRLRLLDRERLLGRGERAAA